MGTIGAISASNSLALLLASRQALTSSVGVRLMLRLIAGDPLRTAGGVGATQIDKEAAAALLAPLPPFSGKPEERLALALASPEFQWR